VTLRPLTRDIAAQLVSWHDVDGTGDNGAQYRLAAVLGLHLDGQIAKYLGEPSIVLSVHQTLDAK
jgi:hypothetical protein